MPQHRDLPEQFGRYHILDKLGTGGMGAVYLAEDTALGRRIALKVPHFKAGDDASVLDRFRREARLAASIDHPNFCPVLDIGEVSGTHYFTMAYIEGTSLSDLVGPQQPWEPQRAVELIRLIAQVVGLLHGKGIIHRDLKPSNVMVRPTGEPVLMDFGLACSFTSQSQRLTATGEVLGTLAYMPPEQLDGDRAKMGPPADVYSLGMILYELVTGKLPFEGPPLAVVHQVGTKAPEPVSSVRPGLDARLDAICLKTLAKKPEERFPDTGTFATALAEFLRAPAEQRVNCPQCGKALRVPASMAGKRLKCPQCGAALFAAAQPQAHAPSDFPETMVPPPQGQRELQQAPATQRERLGQEETERLTRQAEEERRQQPQAITPRPPSAPAGPSIRLTLRTLLAYLDDTLEPAYTKVMGQKVAESEAAQELIARIKQGIRRRDLTAPAGPAGERLDANTVGEYLDNELAADQVAELEKLCLESDVHLAEVAACHQILTLVLGEPALVPPIARQRMHHLVASPESRQEDLPKTGFFSNLRRKVFGS